MPTAQVDEESLTYMSKKKTFLGILLVLKRYFRLVYYYCWMLIVKIGI